MEPRIMLPPPLSPSIQTSYQPREYIIFVLGTHVMGKFEISTALSDTLSCPNLHGEYIAAAATVGALSKHKSSRMSISESHPTDLLELDEETLKETDGDGGKNNAVDDGQEEPFSETIVSPIVSKTFQRMWLSKVRRTGFLNSRQPQPSLSLSSPSSPVSPSFTHVESTLPQQKPYKVLMVMTMTACRAWERQALRELLVANDITPIFVTMKVEVETMIGRTLGAETLERKVEVLRHKTLDQVSTNLAHTTGEPNVVPVDSEKEIEQVVKDSVKGVLDLLNRLGSA